MSPLLILIIEDEAGVRRFIRTGLESQGHRVEEAKNATEGLSLAMQYVPDVILLDLGLPDSDGVTVIRSLRAWSTVPILVISARTHEREKVLALDAGADDYLTKPFGFPELLARIRSAMRRVIRNDISAILQIGLLKIDLEARQVFIADVEIHLTPTEYKLLAVLARHAGKVVTHHQLLDAVWGPKHASQQPHLRVYMAHLRRKLEDKSGGNLFSTEAGVGYRLRLE